MLKGISFQVLRAEYENPFFSYSRLYLGIWIFLQNRVHGAFFTFHKGASAKHMDARMFATFLCLIVGGGYLAKCGCHYYQQNFHSHFCPIRVMSQLFIKHFTTLVR